MNEDVFTMAVRKFLKEVGVTSQREIERAVQERLDSGSLNGEEILTAHMTLTIEGLDFEHRVEGDIALS